VIINETGSTSLSCDATSNILNVTITFTWEKFDNTTNTWRPATGTLSGNDTMTINVQQDQEGVYRCIASNSAGNTSSKPATVTVYGELWVNLSILMWPNLQKRVFNTDPILWTWKILTLLSILCDPSDKKGLMACQILTKILKFKTWQLFLSIWYPFNLLWCRNLWRFYWNLQNCYSIHKSGYRHYKQTHKTSQYWVV